MLFTIVFDLDDTIVYTHHLYREAIWRCGLIIQLALGHRAPAPEVLLEYFDRTDDTTALQDGNRIERFPRSWVVTYHHFCGAAGVPPRLEVERQLLTKALVFTRGPFTPIPGAISVLRNLAIGGHRLHLITAGDPRLQPRKIRALGIDRLFRSAEPVEFGCKKKRLAEIKAAEPGPWIMVGDARGGDIAPALELGMIGVWLSEGDPWHLHDTELDPRSHHTIRTLAELPPLLEQIEREYA